MAKEKDYYKKIQQLLKILPPPSCAVELKLVKGNRFSLKSVPEHQRLNLRSVSTGSFTYKIADVGLAPKPFDIVKLSSSPAYLAVIFYKEKKESFVYFIEYKKIPFASISLTEDECRDISDFVYRV